MIDLHRFDTLNGRLYNRRMIIVARKAAQRPAREAPAKHML